LSVAFQARTGPIIVEAEVAGPTATLKATMILDTGATTTSLSLKVLRLIGYDPGMAIGQAQLITGTGISTVPLLMVNRLSALGQHAIGLRVLARSLPAGAAADGLLGLDFVRGHVLTIDFPQGHISLV
jgi:gag-polyprotein putative aspartyl protease